MEEIILNGVQLGFNDLSEQTQKKLYLQDKKKFEKEVAKSLYVNIRKLLIEDEECESSILDEVFNIEVEIYKNIDNLLQIWNHPKFEKTDEKRKVLAEERCWRIRMIPAKDEKSTSEFLNEMLRKEVQDEEKDDDADVKEAIMRNPSFRMEEETIDVFANSQKWINRELAAREETDYLKLNEMWKRERQNSDDVDVKIAILKNVNFKVTEENIKIFANSENWIERIVAAKSEYASVEFLEQMYLEENDSDVLEAIERNLDKKLISKHEKLSFIQKEKIKKVLKRFRKSKDSVSKCLNEILEIIS